MCFTTSSTMDAESTCQRNKNQSILVLQKKKKSIWHLDDCISKGIIARDFNVIVSISLVMD
jgi:hypothetical protein